MQLKKVKDLMVPLSEYATVNEGANLLDAIDALERSQLSKSAGEFRHRAVLVIDKNGGIMGKLGHLAFLKALEPKYNLIGDIPALSRAGLSSDFISNMMEHMGLWEDNLSDIYRRAKNTLVKNVMHPVTESIQEDASISEAVHDIIIHQSLSIIVLRGKQPVGILRLGDVYTYLASAIKECAKRE